MLQPLGNCVVIRREETQTESIGGIILPDGSADKPDRGEVIAVGPGRVAESGDKIEMVVVVGNTVVFGQGSGIEIEEDGETFVVLYEEEVIGTII